jgi:3-hydroxyisobutyrate dehydrogenase-like beta-hydroxyacid dehydrogenase
MNDDSQNVRPAATSIAVIGVGAMGSRIAQRLIDHGYRVVVWNRTADKARPLADRGAEAATSPADAAARCDAVITMVANPAALTEVVEGESGIAAGLRSDGTVIEMSTVGPQAISWLASALSEGTRVIDAPVLGSIGEAESGSLAIFVGGPEQLFSTWRGVLSVLGSPIHVGPLGSGAAAKLVANLSLLGTLTLVGEAVAFADALELEREAAWEVLAVTPIAEQVKRRRPLIERNDFPRRFSLALARKDADLILEEARERGLDLRVGTAAHSWLAAAQDEGWADDDYSVVLRRIIASDNTRPR